MFPLTVTLHNIDQLRAVMGAIGDLPTTPFAAPVSAPTAAAASLGRVPKAKTEPKTEQAAPAAPVEAPVAPAGIDRAAIAKAITAYAAANGRDATLKKLQEFGVSSGKELTPEQYPAALSTFTVVV